MNKITVQYVINRLLNADRPRRSFEEDIATVLGWKKTVETMPDPRLGSKQIAKWYPPGSDQPVPLPKWTSNLQDAYELATALAGEEAIAFSWRGETVEAQIHGYEKIEGINPAIAICIVSLSYIKNRPLVS